MQQISTRRTSAQKAWSDRFAVPPTPLHVGSHHLYVLSEPCCLRLNVPTPLCRDYFL
jgi:hypothetical protein